jgi:tetratricopeptide (TPR) repeat protein
VAITDAQVEAARERATASPTDAAAQFALGNALWWTGRHDEAIAAFLQAIAVRPDHAEARNNLGNALMESGRAAEAVGHYRAALAIRPDHAPTLYNLGNALLAAGDAEAAEAQFRAALAINPDHAGAHNNLGNLLRAQGRTAEAAASYREAVRLRPDAAGSHNNLGSALLALYRADEALDCFTEAVRLQPDYAEALNNLGGALLALDRPADAATAFRRAVELDPEQVQARFGEALALLSLGRFAEGWAAYESRWLDPRFREGVRPCDSPRWEGQDIAGRTILLRGEQGLGDTIQFVRYAKLVRARGARVILEVPAALLPLFTDLADAVLAEGADLPPHDLHCPLLSLPRIFRTDLGSIPADVPYVHADPARVAAWRDLLGPSRKPRVALALSGSAEHPEDALRSIPAERLRPLLALHGVEFHVAQKDVRETDAAVLREFPDVRVHADRLSDFAETAALLTQMDLVVSVDTALAHLAGAMALPVWVFVQSSADFRWLRGRDDSPWYPTMRLFRQAMPLAWDSEVARMAAAVAGFAR